MNNLLGRAYTGTRTAWIKFTAEDYVQGAMKEECPPVKSPKRWVKARVYRTELRFCEAAPLLGDTT